jgi:hypothetical protein
MLEIKVDELIRMRNLHPESTQELFDLLEENRRRLRPWVIPYFLPETYKDTRQFAIHSLFDYYGIPTGYSEIDQYLPELENYFRGDNLSLVLEIRHQHQRRDTIPLAFCEGR